MASLEGKRVLLIAPQFFGYEVEIRMEIERRGAKVDWLADRLFDKPWQKALTRLSPELLLPFATRNYLNALQEFGRSHYDSILVVNGQTVSSAMIRALRNSFPKSRIALYMWDSFENRGRIRELLRYYDAAFSFDPSDSRTYGMSLRPLFHVQSEQAPSASNDYHLSFIGTMHSDRYSVLDKLRRNAPEGTRAFWYLYLQAEWVYWIYRLGKPAMRHTRKAEFHFTPLAKSIVHDVHSRTLAIVDIEHPDQRGLTMRTFEALGAGKKLVTTNRSVRGYDFYRDENVCVIDRDYPRVSAEFMASAYAPIEPHLYYKYSVAGWVDDVLNAGLVSSTLNGSEHSD